MSEQRLVGGGQGRSEGDTMATAGALALAAWACMVLGFLAALCWLGAWSALLAAASVGVLFYCLGRGDGRRLADLEANRRVRRTSTNLDIEV